MHSKDGLHTVFVSPVLYQFQNGGYVIRVHVIPLTSPSAVGRRTLVSLNFTVLVS